MFESLIHVSQVTKNDCGIACIDMILKYYGYDENYTDKENHYILQIKAYLFKIWLIIFIREI